MARVTDKSRQVRWVKRPKTPSTYQCLVEGGPKVGFGRSQLWGRLRGLDTDTESLCRYDVPRCKWKLLFFAYINTRASSIFIFPRINVMACLSILLSLWLILITPPAMVEGSTTRVALQEASRIYHSTSSKDAVVFVTAQGPVPPSASSPCTHIVGDNTHGYRRCPPSTHP